MKNTQLRTGMIVGGFALALAGGAAFTLREAFHTPGPKAAAEAEGSDVSGASAQGAGPAPGGRIRGRTPSAAGAATPGASEVVPVREAPEFYPDEGQITDLASLDAAHLVMLEAHPEMKEQLEQLRADIEADMQEMAAAGGE